MLPLRLCDHAVDATTLVNTTTPLMRPALYATRAVTTPLMRQPHYCDHSVKTGVHLNAINGNVSSNPKTLSLSHKSVLWRLFWYVWEKIVFLKGFVKFKEIRNIEDLMKL